MKDNFKNMRTKYFFFAFFVLFAISTTAYAQGWVGNTCTPPECNAQAPVHVGKDQQFKDGILGAREFLSNKITVVGAAGELGAATAGQFCIDNGTDPASCIDKWPTGSGTLGGSGTANFFPKWNATGDGLIDSGISQDASGNVGIGTSPSPTRKVDIFGTENIVSANVRTSDPTGYSEFSATNDINDFTRRAAMGVGGTQIGNGNYYQNGAYFVAGNSLSGMTLESNNASGFISFRIGNNEWLKINGNTITAYEPISATSFCFTGTSNCVTGTWPTGGGGGVAAGSADILLKRNASGQAVDSVISETTDGSAHINNTKAEVYLGGFGGVAGYFAGKVANVAQNSIYLGGLTNAMTVNSGPFMSGSTVNRKHVTQLGYAGSGNTNTSAGYFSDSYAARAVTLADGVYALNVLAGSSTFAGNVNIDPAGFLTANGGIFTHGITSDFPSTFRDGITVASTTGTSTFANGINIARGCFAVNGVCVTGGGSGSGTVNSGTAGQVPYYKTAGSALTATSTLFVSTAENVGIGTSVPGTKLDVAGTIKATGFQLGTSATAGQVLTAGSNGVGTWQTLTGLQHITDNGSGVTISINTGISGNLSVGGTEGVSAQKGIFPGISFASTTPLSPSKGSILQAYDNAGSATWVATSTLGLNTVNAGTAGYLPFYQTTGNVLSATSTLFLDTQGNFGVGTQSPTSGTKLDVVGKIKSSSLDTGAATTTGLFAASAGIKTNSFTLSTTTNNSNKGNVLTSDASGVATWRPMQTYINTRTINLTSSSPAGGIVNVACDVGDIAVGGSGATFSIGSGLYKPSAAVATYPGINCSGGSCTQPTITIPADGATSVTSDRGVINGWSCVAAVNHGITCSVVCLDITP